MNDKPWCACFSNPNLATFTSRFVLFQDMEDIATKSMCYNDDAVSYWHIWFVTTCLLDKISMYIRVHTGRGNLKRRGTWGFAVLQCWCFFDAVNKISICGDLKSYGVRCLCFSRCGVQWNEITCGAVVSCVMRHS